MNKVINGYSSTKTNFFVGPSSPKGSDPLIDREAPDWRGVTRIEAEVVGIRTCTAMKRHMYQLMWKGGATTLAAATVPREVDKGFVERYRVRQ